MVAWTSMALGRQATPIRPSVITHPASSATSGQALNNRLMSIDNIRKNLRPKTPRAAKSGLRELSHSSKPSGARTRATTDLRPPTTSARKMAIRLLGSITTEKTMSAGSAARSRSSSMILVVTSSSGPRAIRSARASRCLSITPPTARFPKVRVASGAAPPKRPS